MRSALRSEGRDGERQKNRWADLGGDRKGAKILKLNFEIIDKDLQNKQGCRLNEHKLAVGWPIAGGIR